MSLWSVCHHCCDSQAVSWCLCVKKKDFLRSFFFIYWFNHLNFIEKAKNSMFYNDSAAIIRKVNLEIGFNISSVIQFKWLWNNDYVKTQPSQSDLHCSSGCYNSRTAAKQTLKLMC